MGTWHFDYSNSSGFRPRNVTWTSLTPGKQTELSIFIIVTACLCVLGTFSNIPVLRITWPRAKRTYGITVLIFHLVLANFFMCAVNIPINVLMVYIKTTGVYLNPGLCNFIQPFYAINNEVIFWADTCLAVNRVIALFYPYRYKTWTSRKVNFFMVALGWVVSGATIAPMGFNVGGSLGMLAMGQCATIPRGVLGLILATIGMHIPFTVAGVASLLVLGKSYHLLRHCPVAQGQQGKRLQKSLLRRLKLAEMSAFICLSSTVFNVPWIVVTGVFPSALDRDPVSIMWFKTCLACQYGFSPCIMLLSNVEYRMRLRRIVGAVFGKQRNQSGQLIVVKQTSRPLDNSSV